MSSGAATWWPDYAERADVRESAAARLGRATAAALARTARAGARRSRALGARVRALQQPLRGLDAAALRAAACACRGAAARRSGDRALVLQCFALVREAARRSLGMEHFDSQLAAGAALVDGAIVEMPTGEGKTLAATLAACVHAFAGKPVHVITANDYLAARDAEWMRPVYELLGLSVGVVTSGADPAARRRAYGCDVAYCCNKEIVFDYLRDRRFAGPRTPAHLQFERLYGARARGAKPLLRGLHAAIVDEADSVLIDETRTPLILSQAGGGENHSAVVLQALELARALTPERDYRADRIARKAELTAHGCALLAGSAAPLGGAWSRARWREQLVAQALAALVLYRRDEDYLLRDGKVLVIDEHTGRALPGRSWGQKLHQLIEAKEGVAISAEPETLARISYQRFFRRYRHLAGMTGTAREVTRELRAVYGLGVVAIAPHVPSRQRAHADRVFAGLEDKWRAVVARIGAVHATGRPVLVGTASVAASEQLSRSLSAAGFVHCVLNARQDRGEAEIVARAGEPGRITIATNIAGRGTDIRLGEGVAEIGGLHVIATERHEAGRIDRQLLGRCARQGDPGSCEMLLSLEDSMLERAGGWVGTAAARRIAAGTLGFGSAAAAALLRAAQARTQRVHARARAQLLRADHKLDQRLAFAGPAE